MVQAISDSATTGKLKIAYDMAVIEIPTIVLIEETLKKLSLSSLKYTTPVSGVAKLVAAIASFDKLTIESMDLVQNWWTRI